MVSSSGSALLSAVSAFAASSTASASRSGYLVGCWSGLSVQSGVVLGVASGFGPSAYVVLKGSVLASLLVSGLLVGSGLDDSGIATVLASDNLLPWSPLLCTSSHGSLGSGSSLVSCFALGGSWSHMVSAYVDGSAVSGMLVGSDRTVGSGAGVLVHAAGLGVSAACGLPSVVHVFLCLLVLMYTLSVLLVGYASLFGSSSQASG